jgi:hypothetical protein
VFENRVLRKTFGRKKDKVTREWRKLHNEQLYSLYSSPNITRVIKSKRMRCSRHVAYMGERTGAYRVLVRPQGKSLLERPRRRWEDTIKMDLQEVRGAAVVKLLRHCASNRQVAGSIPDGVSGFFS